MTPERVVPKWLVWIVLGTAIGTIGVAIAAWIIIAYQP